MSEPFLGQIQAFGFNFAPRGWSLCDGQLLPISSNSALFSLLGTTYGGDGRTTFALPDLRGRSMLHQGTGNGLAPSRIGQKGGTENTTLAVANMPSHTHALHAETKAGDQANPQGRMLAISPNNIYVSPDPADNRVMAAESIAATGNGTSFSNEDPYLVLNICIALQGVFPSRS